MNIVRTLVYIFTFSTLCVYATPEPFHSYGELSQPVKDIFKVLGHPEITCLSEANAYAQKNLIRTGERWDTQKETELAQLIRKESSTLINSLKQLGMIGEIKPESDHYAYVALFGGLRERFELRLAYLEKLVEAGLKFDCLVLLGGMRELRDVEKEGLPGDITQELWMMGHLVKKSTLKNYTIFEVNAPMVQKPDGTLARPTTDDTIKHFAQSAQKEGSVLVVSNSPFTQRQTKVAQRLLDQSKFPVDGAGPALDLNTSDLDVLMMLDELARTFYEDTQARR